MIRAENIRKTYGILEVLKGIDIDIPPRSVVSIVGASGAGKTTLLQILGTLTRPDSGKVIFNGVNISEVRPAEIDRLRNRQIGFVFQFHNLFPEFTALENVCIPAFIGRTPKRQAEQKALELLDFLGLSQRIHHKPGELSGGEQQRVAVARALINDPAVVFADEPSGNLDSLNKEELHKLFFTLRDTFGKTFVIVTHDNHLADMSDRKFVMSDGRML